MFVSMLVKVTDGEAGMQEGHILFTSDYCLELAWSTINMKYVSIAKRQNMENDPSKAFLHLFVFVLFLAGEHNFFFKYNQHFGREEGMASFSGKRPALLVLLSFFLTKCNEIFSK